MKKHLFKNTYAAIVTLFIAMLALPNTAQAQGKAKIILEAHDVWGDGSGYQMLLDADHNLYGDKIPDNGPIWTDANPPSDLYDGFEYKIPANADPSTTPEHMVMDGEDYVEIPAGVYDFCITAPQAGKKIWIAGDSDAPTRADDYNFEAGKTYRFTMYIDANDNDAAKLIITGSGEVQTYDLEIAGTKVTSDNCGDLSVIKGVSGTVNYDPSTKTLTLQNATISAGEKQALVSRTKGLTIKLVGTNDLSSSTATIGITEAGTITGEGATLNVLSETTCAVFSNTADITIEDCTVNTKGAYGFLARDDDYPENLIIKNATVTADGWDGPIKNFANLTMISCSITQPAGAVFDTKQKVVMLNGELVKSKVVIEPAIKYNLQIIGNHVTADNCGNLSVFDGVSGTVKYDPDDNILTLENATINSTTDNGIVSYIDGLTIKVIGTNSLTTTDRATLSFRRPLTITGGGTLNVKSETDCAVFANETDLTIDNCIVNAESGSYGIAGKTGESEKLTIRNATVTAIGTKEGSVVDFAELPMEGCSITQPTGAAFDPSLHGVALNGEKVKTKVVIKKDPSAIEPLSVDTATRPGIYTLQGIRLRGDLNDLPKGVYIVNGRKVVKQ